MFKRFKRNAAANRLIEERLYEEALAEIESGKLRVGLWAKALANSSGDEGKSRGLYLKYRVQSMIDEAEIEQAASERVEEEILRPKRKKREYGKASDGIDWG
ncbi:MAG: hypothetical protein RPT25_16175 [Cycloclasticus sp.]|jgi:hypothetical protein